MNAAKKKDHPDLVQFDDWRIGHLRSFLSYKERENVRLYEFQELRDCGANVLPKKRHFVLGSWDEW